jgi:hypothetical protein
MTDYRSPPDWRRRAAEIRKLADDVPDGGRRWLLQRIARDYNVIDEIAEERRARNRRSMPSGVAA